MVRISKRIRGLEQLSEKMKEIGIDSDWGLMKESMTGGKRSMEMGKMQEFLVMLQKAQEAVHIEDPDHLYVPGKVYFLYPYMTEAPPEGEERDIKYNSAIIDGKHPCLRVMNLTKEACEEHFLPGYSKSLDACLGK
jgi:hypothetical protein